MKYLMPVKPYNPMWKCPLSLILLFVFSYLRTEAQTRDGLETELVRLGMENVFVLDTDTICTLVFENNVNRLKDFGTQTIIRQLPFQGKPVCIILLENNVPVLQLFSATGSNSPDEWTASYNIDTDWKNIHCAGKSNTSLFKFDLVIYPELNFRNIKLEKMYDWMVNISPAIEFSAWKGMRFTGQVIFPLVNQYGEQYKQIRPGIIAVSQQVRFPYRWFAKATIGTFTRDRWGADLKIFRPFRNERFAFRAQAGLTGTSSWWNWRWYYSLPKRLTWSVGGQYYNPRYQVQTMLRVSRYLAGDYGVRADMMRHFRYTTIGFYGLKTNKSRWNGGFYFTVALPPYKQKRNKFLVTTSDYFNMEYNAGADLYYGQSYKTSPGENFSEENFNPFFILNN